MARKMYIAYYVTESNRFVCLFHGSKKNAFEVANLYVNCANALSKEINESIVKVGVNSYDGETERTEHEMYL